MPSAVYAIGVGRTDFRRNFLKEGATLREAVVEAGRGAIRDAGIEPRDVGAGVVGNFAAGQFIQQGHLGSYLCEIDPALRGIPTSRAEAACASGSVAVLNAVHQIAAGAADVVLVVGAEQQKTMSAVQGADVLGGAGDYAAEKPTFGPYVFPGLFGHIARVYRDRHGLSDEAIANVSVKNRLHATLNPLAQMRDKSITREQAMTVSEANSEIAPPLKLCDCSQITDGAAAVVLCSEAFYRRLGAGREDRGVSRGVRLLGYGHTTDYLPVGKKDVPTFSIARRAAERAYATAGITPAELHGVEVHDCFAITEIVAYELLGLAESGGGATLAESGWTALPSVRSQLGSATGSAKVPVVNPGGGLIGDGHPVGATGVRQVVEAVTQLRGKAGARQIEGARRYMTFNMGGTLTSTVAMIWGS